MRGFVLSKSKKEQKKYRFDKICDTSHKKDVILVTGERLRYDLLILPANKKHKI